MSLEIENGALFPVLEVECLFNGRWSEDVTKWGCTSKYELVCFDEQNVNIRFFQIVKEEMFHQTVNLYAHQIDMHLDQNVP